MSQQNKAKKKKTKDHCRESTKNHANPAIKYEITEHNNRLQSFRAHKHMSTNNHKHIEYRKQT